MQNTLSTPIPARTLPADEPRTVTAARLAARLRAAAQLLDTDPELSPSTVVDVRAHLQAAGHVLFILLVQSVKRPLCSALFLRSREARV